MADELTPKQRVFVREYVANGGNGTAALMKAYPAVTSENSAAAMASENLRKPNIQRPILRAFQRAGITDDKLAEIHGKAIDLMHDENVAAKNISLRAVKLAYQVRGDVVEERGTPIAALGDVQINILATVLTGLSPAITLDNVIDAEPETLPEV